MLAYLKDDRNWGRWGDDDQLGAVNMITPEKRIEAAGLVKSGQAISLSREFPGRFRRPTTRLRPIHYMKKVYRSPTAGFSADYYGISYHGTATTHLDALCHVWDENGMWNGRNPDEQITMDGAQWGAVHHWNQGLITRGVLLDVPKHRGTPVRNHGYTRSTAGSLRTSPRSREWRCVPGDASAGVWRTGGPITPTAIALWGSNPLERPGLHMTCLQVHPRVRHLPARLGHDGPYAQWIRALSWAVHGSIFAYGIGLLDNALLQPLAEACAEEGRYEFMLTVNPLRVVGGTGSPVNPVAIL